MSTVLSNITKEFGKTTALSSVNLTIGDGEFVAIVGPSGCGKTTMLRLLAGFDSPTSGEVKMNNEIVAHAGKIVRPEKRNIGMVFQSFALWPHLKVKEQVRFPLKHHRYVDNDLKRNNDQRVMEMLRLVGLENYAERMPNELSGGQKQRVAIARALAPKPALLLMDEPLSSLDAELRMELRKEIQTIHRMMKTSIVYVTHDQAEALAMADKIVVMKDGQVEQAGSPEEVYMRPRTPFVATFVGKANLIKGKWLGDAFKPAHDDQVLWITSDVTAEMKKHDVLPVRPEQFQLMKTGSGLKGIVRNVMFQGKEIHYSIDVNGQLLNVHSSYSTKVAVGDEVVLTHTDYTIERSTFEEVKTYS
ncbi:ABC transporter ATP-binding protein [Bacillus sp. JCM 19034]|uniref:ABC transporter ATP-binding protein n=1 Tax=Bacillus sp. JCM 19034 TaxID=1481928 RepID=UPI0007850A06|nr:ABC transporter ATP-binding protein [Bacillus sp. JCM 19034]